MTPKLSVVIPCYNMGDFVQEAIVSALDYPIQQDIEIIVINDGSNDDNYTKSVLDTYTNPNLIVVHQENQGLGAARNRGIELAKAPYVIPLDADNILRPIYISEACKILDQHDDIAFVYGQNKKIGLRSDIGTVGEFDICKLLIKNYIDACVVMRKSAWKSVSGYDEQMPIMGYEDWDINLRLFFKGWKFYFLEKICFDYRVRENSMLVNSNENRDALIQYMFDKPELEQAKRLRIKLVDFETLSKLHQDLKKRKVISTALKIEKPIKSIFNMFKRN